MEPQFEGQTKTKLGNNEVMGAVDMAVGEALSNYLEENPKQARAIVDKVILAATARHAARKAREMVQRKNPAFGKFPCQGNWQTARCATPKSVKSSWSKETLPEDRPNRDATGCSRPYSPCEAKS